MSADTLIANELRRIAALLDSLGYKIKARRLLYAANLLEWHA